MEQSNPGGPVVFFKNALEKNPYGFQHQIDLAKAYTRLGKLEQAETELQRDSTALERARAYLNQGRIDKTTALVDQMLLQKPELIGALRLRPDMPPGPMIWTRP